MTSKTWTFDIPPEPDSPVGQRCGCVCGCHNSDHWIGCKRWPEWREEWKVWACDECLAYCDESES